MESTVGQSVESLPPLATGKNPSAGGTLSWLVQPTVADFLFALVIVISFLSGAKGWSRLFLDGDAGLHIRIGDVILASGKVPTTDPFSFSLPGGVWYAFEWGSETLQAALHQAWGLKGVALMSGVVLGLSFVVVFLFALWRGANGGASVMLTMFAVNAATIHFHARPHIFTMLLLVCAAWMVEADLRKPGWRIWLLAPLVVVWANLHGGFPVLFVLLGLNVAGLAVEGFFLPDDRVARWREAAKLCGVGVGCALASLMNPYGYHLHQHILEVMQAKWLMVIVDEFKAPTFRTEQQMVYMMLLFVGVGMVGRMVTKRRFREAILILFFAMASLTSVRHVPLYALVMVPLVAVELTEMWSRFAVGLSRASLMGILDDISNKLASGNRHPSVWMAVFVAAIALAPNVTWPSDLSSELFPEMLVTKYRDRLATAKVFAPDQWAGYLVYRNYPRQKVFFDGRHNYYGEKLVNEALDMVNAKPKAKELLDKYQFDYVLVPPDASLVTLLQLYPEWKLIDKEEKAVLYGRVRS